MKTVVDLRALAFAAYFLSLMACSAETSPAETELVDVPLEGIAFGYVDRGCFITPLTDFTVGEVVAVLEVGSTEKRVTTLSAVNVPSDLCGSRVTKSLRQADSQFAFHMLTDEIALGIAWRQVGIAKLSTNKLSSSSCKTSEGIRYRLTDDVTGDVVWEGYEPLGYGTEADCTN